jgi:hypothetical protein
MKVEIGQPFYAVPFRQLNYTKESAVKVTKVGSKYFYTDNDERFEIKADRNKNYKLYRSKGDYLTEKEIKKKWWIIAQRYQFSIPNIQLSRLEEFIKLIEESEQSFD